MKRNPAIRLLLSLLAVALLAIGLAPAVAPTGAHAATKPPVKVKLDAKPYTTGGAFPYDIAVSPKNGNLYVLDHGKSLVSVLNAKTGKQIAKIKLTNAKIVEPNAIVAVGSKLYVLDGYRDRLYIISATKNKVVGTVKINTTANFDEPETLVASRDGKYLYIGAHISNRILVFDIAKKKVTHRYDISAALKAFPADAGVTGTQVVDIETSDNGRYLYLSLMTTFAVDTFSSVAVYDTKAKKVTAVESSEEHPIGVPNTEFYDLLNVGGDKVYRSVSTETTDGHPFYVEVLDLSNPKKIKSVDTIPMPKNNIPYMMLYSHGYVFVSNPDNDGFTKYLPSPDTVQIIDTHKKGKKAVVGSFHSKTSELLVGALSKNGKTAYFINGGSLDKGWKGLVTVAHFTF
ncbi:MAG: YncE family protein [Propionibacteriaceae bacterium]|jgi:YVTN family beta-propeller protein|nr:YncE family protein [Propionibacteriaceae bacterium]